MHSARALADPRQKVALDLMAYAVCRPDSINDGVDGLRVSGFPDLAVPSLLEARRQDGLAVLVALARADGQQAALEGHVPDPHLEAPLGQSR